MIRLTGDGGASSQYIEASFDSPFNCTVACGRLALPEIATLGVSFALSTNVRVNAYGHPLTCIISGTAIIHTHSQPITSSPYNTTAAVVGPTGTGVSSHLSYSANSSTSVFAPTGVSSQFSYTANATSASAGPTGTGSSPSLIFSHSANVTSSKPLGTAANSESRYTTYTTTCTENGKLM